MKNRMNGAYIIRFLCLALFLLPIIPAGASVLPDDEQTETTKELIAFPGAEGFGRNTTGGRGGKVYHVRKGRYATPYHRREHVRLSLM